MIREINLLRDTVRKVRNRYPFQIDAWVVLQRHYWEHVIRDDLDYQCHVDYVHVNPLKHGYVKCVEDWPYSTFYQ